MSVALVLIDHPFCQTKVVSQDRWSFIAGSQGLHVFKHMKPGKCILCIIFHPCLMYYLSSLILSWSVISQAGICRIFSKVWVYKFTTKGLNGDECPRGITNSSGVICKEDCIKHVKDSEKSFIHIRNTSGPRTEPWGTLHLTVLVGECTFFNINISPIFSLCCLGDETACMEVTGCTQLQTITFTPAGSGFVVTGIALSHGKMPRPVTSSPQHIWHMISCC